jgi:hypothetical protein
LNCKSHHGGETFEILVDESDRVILCLHKWGDHEHPTLNLPELHSGNGLILYFRVSDLEIIWQNAKRLNATIEEPLNVNPNSGKDEFSLRDIDGYFIIVSM